jgi:hypothetical protein
MRSDHTDLAELARLTELALTVVERGLATSGARIPTAKTSI